MTIQVAISFGEFLDKLTILEIKAERIGDPDKRANVVRDGSRTSVPNSSSWRERSITPMMNGPWSSAN